MPPRKKRATTPEDRFTQEVIRARARRDWTQTQLAEELTRAGLPNANRPLVAKIEAGERALRLDEAVSLSNALGIDLRAFSTPALRNKVKSEARDLSAAVNDYDQAYAYARYAFGALADDDSGDDPEVTQLLRAIREQLDGLSPVVGQLHYRSGCISALAHGEPLPRDPATITDEEREARLQSLRDAGFAVQGDDNG